MSQVRTRLKFIKSVDFYIMFVLFLLPSFNSVEVFASERLVL